MQLDKVIGYHHVADDVETKIQVGPGGDVESYIKVGYKYTTPFTVLLCMRCCEILWRASAGVGATENGSGLLPQQQPSQRGAYSSPRLL